MKIGLTFSQSHEAVCYKVKGEQETKQILTLFFPQSPQHFALGFLLGIGSVLIIPTRERPELTEATPAFQSPAQQGWVLSFTVAVFSQEMSAYSFSCVAFCMDKPWNLILKKLNVCKHSFTRQTFTA